MDQFKELRRKNFLTTKNQICSYVAYIGDLNLESEVNHKNDDKQLQIFVVINKLNFEVASKNIAEAVDLRYKSFAALSISFSCKCKHVRIFLQNFFFKTGQEPLKPYNCIKTLTDKVDRNVCDSQIFL